MPGLLFAFSPLAVMALVVWSVAALLLLFEVFRMRQALQRGEGVAWY